MLITDVTDEMVPQVKEFLSSRPEFGYCQNWDGVFKYAWKQEKYPYGYAIVHDGKVFGFLGTLFCERVIRENRVVCCNLSAWVVDSGPNGARSLGAALLATILKMPNVLITSFTANEKAKKNYESMGFKQIEDHQIALPTFTSVAELRRIKSVEVLSAPDVIEPYLNEQDGKILGDHKDLSCLHVLVRNSRTGRYCYLIGTTSPIQLRSLSLRIPIARFLSRWQTFNVCYVSDPQFLAENTGAINRHLCREKRSLLMRYDSRLIPERLSRFARKMAIDRLCFSVTNFQAADVDNLYSELVTQNTY